LEFDARKKLNSNFRIAVRENRIDYAKNLLERGADIDSISERRETALMYAAKNCSEKAIRFLLKSKANVNAQDVQGRTALMLAVRESCVPGVRLLLKSRGIMTDARDHLGNRAEDYALRGAVIEVDGAENEIVQLLRKSGQNPIHGYSEG
jgi:ankyrin repeat protein